MKLRKLANNPALSEDARTVLNTQVYYINMLEWWREQYIELQKKYEQLTIKDRKHLVKAKDWTNPKVKAVIKLDVPEWQIGQQVTVYFKDTMCKIGICEAEQE
jgi:rubrerythrin